METQITYKGIDYTVEYEKDGADVTVMGIYYEGKDITPVFDSLNFDYAGISELVIDKENSREYEKNYDL